MHALPWWFRTMATILALGGSDRIEVQVTSADSPPAAHACPVGGTCCDNHALWTAAAPMQSPDTATDGCPFSGCFTIELDGAGHSFVLPRLVFSADTQSPDCVELECNGCCADAECCCPETAKPGTTCSEAHAAEMAQSAHRDMLAKVIALAVERSAGTEHAECPGPMHEALVDALIENARLKAQLEFTEASGEMLSQMAELVAEKGRLEAALESAHHEIELVREMSQKQVQHVQELAELHAQQMMLAKELENMHKLESQNANLAERVMQLQAQLQETHAHAPQVADKPQDERR